MDAFNAMEEANADTTSANSCSSAGKVAFIKNVKREIRAGGKNIEINFFMDAFGVSYRNPTMTESKVIYNRYINDVDYNIIAAASVTGSGAGQPATIQIIRALHSGGGNYSYPTKGYALIDKDNNIYYQITDVDTTIPYAHKIELTPFDENVTVDIKQGVKYLVSPSRIVPGYSCPQPTNDIQNIGYVQQVNPFRFRKDWKVTLDLMRGYADIFRFQVKFGMDGTPYDAWDAYEAARSRESLQLAINEMSLFGSPITNPLLLSGADVITDDIHTGFYGLIPVLESAGQVVDFPVSEGFNLKSDLEPFIMYQDSLKLTNRFMVKAGFGFMASIVDSANNMVRNDGLGLFNFNAYKRADEAGSLEKLAITSYTYLNKFFLDFAEWSSMSDTRLIGSEKLSNMAIFISMDGTRDAKTNQPVAPIEFYQYGDTETGGYIESIRNDWKIDGCESISGSHAQSIAMAVHSPEMHLIANPITYC
jgi:hypothetical protein